MAKKEYTLIDLFCGCGGLSLGFEMAGFDVKLAIDNWEDALLTYRKNHGEAQTLNADLLNLDPKEIEKNFGIHDVSVIIGGPPCQGFSVAGKRIIDDERNKLYQSFVRFVEYYQPKAFVMENVPNILSIGDGVVKDAIIKDFSILGYSLSYKVLVASDYGVPQNRRRAIFVGTKNNDYHFPERIISEVVTVEDAISDLPEFSVEEGTVYPFAAKSDYQRMMRECSLKLYNHQTTSHKDQTVKIISMVPDGGNYKDLPKELQNIRKVHIAWTRLNSKRPSITIDTGHRHHFHYSYNRVPTVREAARIQSFPDDFIFVGSMTSQNKQVGNAVPPLMAKAIAESLIMNLNNIKMKTKEKSQDSIPSGSMRYTVPDEFSFRLHHVRPRFKENVESVLLYVSEVCARLGQMPIRDYKEKMNTALRLYSGNESKTIKTINNWRTEIAALFGLYIEDKKEGITETGKIAYLLNSSADLVQFFKYYLLKFQYPGGHVKSNYNIELINKGVRFKPAKYILNLLYVAEGHIGKPLSITKAEATHCIFNDLRVIRDNRPVVEVVDLILDNRKKYSNNSRYDESGDVIRYAGDILDYMVFANLLKEMHGYYSLNRSENDAILALINDDSFFDGYDSLFGKRNIKNAEITSLEPNWFDYVNSGLDESLFKTDILQYIQDAESTKDDYQIILATRISDVVSDAKNTKEIGDLGELLVIGHEKVRIKNLGREDLHHLIKKIPTSLGVGYDIQSVEEDARKRYIEVKTTISHKRLNWYGFHMTPNEWDSAKTLKDRYYVYRLLISHKDRVLYVLQDPVDLYKKDQIDMAPRDGAEISFSSKVFEPTDLLIWQD